MLSDCCDIAVIIILLSVDGQHGVALRIGQTAQTIHRIIGHVFLQSRSIGQGWKCNPLYLTKWRVGIAYIRSGCCGSYLCFIGLDLGQTRFVIAIVRQEAGSLERARLCSDFCIIDVQL